MNSLARLMQVFFVIVGAVWTTAAIGGLVLRLLKGSLSEDHLLMLFVAMPAFSGVVITGLVVAASRNKKK